MRVCLALAVSIYKSSGLVIHSSATHDEPTADSSLLAADSSILAAGAAQEQCSFEVYDPEEDVLRVVQVGPDSVVFHQGAVDVIDGPTKQGGVYQRYLTFRQDASPQGSSESSAFKSFFGDTTVADRDSAAQQLMRPKCREQVQVTCRSAGPSAGGQQGCDSKLCKPDASQNMVPEYRALLGSALASRGQMSRVSVLGFGAGIVPTAVAQSHPEAVVESVDISSDVLAAAQCFGVEPGDKMKLQEADGRTYLEGLDDGVLDMLFVDIYDDKAHIPPCFTTAEFFAIAKRKLNSGGTLAMNIVTEQLQDVLPSVVASFPDVKLGKLTNNRGNNVLLATTSSSESTVKAGNIDAGFVQEPQSDLSPVFAAWAQDANFAAATREGLSAARADADWCQ